jgi:amino acid adenylation domain-containing protein
VRTRACDLTYLRLDRWSDSIAVQLLGRLGRPSEPVPFLLSQGPLAIATTLGILKAGKFYVPLDPSWGTERAIEIVRRMEARVFLTDGEFATAVRGRTDAIVVELSDAPSIADGPVHLDIDPDQPAYVYFTSGSTGPPKGVVDCHRNVIHNVNRYTQALRIQESDRLTLLQSCGFSGAVSSMFAALLNGATSCPVDMRRETPTSLGRWLDDAAVTIYHSVPSLFRSVTAAGRVFRQIRIVRLEGDLATRLDLELFRRHFAQGSVLAIGLGTTETGLVCQYFFHHGCALPDGVVPIGRPVMDMQVEVRGGNGVRAPNGTAGEIVVKSRFLATGYWKDATATARAFESAGPGSAERVYKTGDRGRIREDGDLEYLGRLDGRTRVRGQWVEPTEIDSALCALPGIREAAVAVIERGETDPCLVAYYVSDGPTRPTASRLRRELSQRLPAHMVPTRFIEIDRLPLSANGKVDRAALPNPTSARPNLAGPLVGPGNLVQLRMSELWEELLGVAPIGIQDDFFDLGGDSLLMVLMLDRVEEILGRSIPMTGLLREGDMTIERLAWLAVTDSPEMADPVVPIRHGSRRPPLFFLHGDYFSGGIYCRELVRHLNPDQPFFALPPCGFDGQPVPRSYEAMAERHLKAIRDIQPSGPYMLGGECNGGLVAYEIARRLEADGEKVSLLLLLSASAQNVRFAHWSAWLRATGRALGLSPTKQRYMFRRLGEFARNARTTPTRSLLTSLLRKAPRIATELRTVATMRDGADLPSLEPGAYRPEGYREQLRVIYQQLDRCYLPGRYGGPVTLIFGREETPDAEAEAKWWCSVAANVETIEVPGDIQTKLTRHVGELAAVLDRLLASVASDGSRCRT